VEAAGSGAARWIRRHGEVLAVFAILAVAAVVRLVRLDLMEFKADEAEACRLALHVLGEAEPGVGAFFPTAGLVASVGIPNPPLFVYLLALPLAVIRTPLAGAAFVAATNVAAVGLCYLAGKRCFSTFVGLASAALFALSPWAIVYSRKIWAQDVLPLFTGLFVLALYAFVVQKRTRAAFWLVLLAGAATQIHFSAWVLVVVAAAAVAVERDGLRWRWVVLGVACVAVLYAPYVWHLIAVNGDTGQAAGDHVVPSALGRYRLAVRYTLAVAGGDKLSLLLGSQSALAFPLSFAFGTAAFAGLVAGARRWRTRALDRFRLLLVLWFVLPVAALTAVRVTPYPHYFIVLYPLPFLGAAFALEKLSQRSLAAGLATLGACLVAFGLLDAGLFRTITREGGARGDYGVAYRHKADAVDHFVRENPARRFELGVVTASAASPEYRFLVWRARRREKRPPLPPIVRYEIVDRLHTTVPPRRRSFRHERFGPLDVVVVPLRPGAVSSQR
jgi:4-amino-4-deoxy-L-arabinose transferase-like glycosyltransferase